MIRGHKKFLVTIAVLLGFVGATYVACAEIFPSGTWRYKITVNVQTPEGLKSGSAVREVHVKKNLAKYLNPDARVASYEVLGEAVAVDLGNRGLVYALIDWDSYEEFFHAFPANTGSLTEFIDYYNRLEAEIPAALPQGNYPKFVRFKSSDDPKSVEILTPEALADGVSLKEILIEKTNENITWGIKNKLPHYNEDFQSWFNSLPYGDEHKVHIYDFSRGAK